MSTVSSELRSVVFRKWYIIDARNKILGRLSSFVTRYLLGKHKVEYVPHVDIGDYVVIINSKQVMVSGKKNKNKIYYHHTGYIGGIKERTFKWMIHHHPERVIEIAVKGMLPKGPLGRKVYRRLKVYSEDVHVHGAHMPELLDLQ